MGSTDKEGSISKVLKTSTMAKQNSSNLIYETTIRLLILLSLIVWCFLILMPFVNILLWSLILAIAMYPLHKKMASKLGNSPKLASFIIVLIAIAIVFIPSWLLVDSLIGEIEVLKANFEIDSFKVPPPKAQIKEWPLIGERIFDIWQKASVDLGQTLMVYKEQLKALASNLFAGILGSLSASIQILIAFVIATIILVFGGLGESVRKFFRKIAGEKGDEFADVTKNTVSSVVKGVIGVAFIVAMIHGVLFMLAGIPYAGIWTILVFILGILQLPIIFISLPIIIYLFAVKSATAAIIWTVILIIAGLSDNVLKPMLLGKGSSVPMLVIFIGVIGGFILSGFIGLFTGAIVMSIGYMLFKGWMDSDEEVQSNNKEI